MMQAVYVIRGAALRAVERSRIVQISYRSVNRTPVYRSNVREMTNARTVSFVKMDAVSQVTAEVEAQGLVKKEIAVSMTRAAEIR